MTPDELENIKRRIAIDREALASYGVDTHYTVADSEALVAEVERLHAALLAAADCLDDAAIGDVDVLARVLRGALGDAEWRRRYPPLAVVEAGADGHQIMPPPPAPGASM